MPYKQRRYLVMKRCPKVWVTRRAEERVKRRLNCKAITLSENYRQWIILGATDCCTAANDKKAYFARHTVTGIQSYIAADDIERIADMHQ